MIDSYINLTTPYLFQRLYNVEWYRKIIMTHKLKTAYFKAPPVHSPKRLPKDLYCYVST